jgi:predicted dehydrogenase
MTSTRPRVGIIGIGTHGMRYANHIRRDVPGLELVGVHRRNGDAARAAAAELGVLAFAEPEALLDAVDAVVIVTPPSSHADLVRAALQRDRYVLVEKPVTRTRDEAETLLDLDRTHGGRTMVAHTLRYDPVIAGARARLGDVGPVHFLRMAQRLSPTGLAWQRDAEVSGGGSILLTGVHLFDSAAWILGEAIDITHCTAERVINPVTEDFFLAVGRTPSGIHLSFEVSKYTTHRACILEVVGERGQLLGDYVIDHHLARGVGPDRERLPGMDPVPTVREALRGFEAFVRGIAPNPIPLEEGANAVAVADRCYERSRLDPARFR